MAVETLRPNAAGDECNIAQAHVACPNHYTCVDEAVADGNTTLVYVSNVTAWQRDFYNIDDHSVGSGVINKITVKINGCIFNTTSQDHLKICIKSGTGDGAPDTPSEGSGQQMTTDFAEYTEEWATNPATSAAWTWDEIDKLQAGVSIRRPHINNTTKVTQVYVEVDYTAVTEKTSSDSGSGSDARLSGNPLALMSKAESGSGTEDTPASEAT